MYMGREKFAEIRNKYSTLLVLDGDASEALAFAQDMLEAEAGALKEKCPYATRSIADTENAARTVMGMRQEIENNEFEG